MFKAIALVFLIYGHLLVANNVEAKRFFGVGQRIEGDQLLLKDIQHSRPALSNASASIVFNYNIAEPITYIEIVSEENISAAVKFSYIDSLVVGMVSLGAYNETETFDMDTSSAHEFDVTITIFGFNKTMMNINPALLLNRDAHFEGELRPYDDDDEEFGDDYAVESFNRTQLLRREQVTDAPSINLDDFEDWEQDFKDKVIEIGQRQPGDDLIYETSQSSPDASKEPTNHTVIFYYIDSDFITYVKFVIIEHFESKSSTAEDYVPPVAEYSHYSPGTLKATITDFNVTSMFVQIFIYGYRGREAPPEYKPFLPSPHWERTKELDERRAPELTPAQRLQLLLLTGKSTPATTNDEDEDDDDDDEVDGAAHPIRPEDMVPDHIPNAALEQQKFGEQQLYAMLGLMLFAVA